MRNSKMYALRLHIVNDADCIKELDKQENKQAFIKSLIRREIKFNDTIESCDQGNRKSGENTH